MVNVFERKILHLIENIMAKIFRITSSRYGCHITGLHTKKQCQHRHCNKNYSALYNITKITIGYSNIYDLCHFQRNENLHHDLQNYEKRRQQ